MTIPYFGLRANSLGSDGRRSSPWRLTRHEALEPGDQGFGHLAPMDGRHQMLGLGDVQRGQPLGGRSVVWR